MVAFYFVNFAKLDLCFPELSFLYDFGLGPQEIFTYDFRDEVKRQSFSCSEDGCRH